MAVKNILIIDDDKVIRSVLSSFLTDQKYNTYTLENGLNCCETVENYSIDFVLLDIEMPHKDGFETLQELKNHFPALPVVMITGHKNNLAMANQLNSNINLLKPLDFDQILEIITKL